VRNLDLLVAWANLEASNPTKFHFRFNHRDPRIPKANPIPDQQIDNRNEEYRDDPQAVHVYPFPPMSFHRRAQ
jgi:hypothetical protein